MAEPAVRVRLQRTGGFAGIPLTAELTSAALSTAQVQEIQRLATAIDLAEQPVTTPGVPDGFRYTIDIWHGTEHTHIVATDPVVAPPVRRLIALVTELATPSN